jgi:WD40 repeat protein
MGAAAALDAVYRPAAHLMTKGQAQRIVHFVAGESARSGEADADRRPTMTSVGDHDVEPALLSLICRELNEARKSNGRVAFDDKLIDDAAPDVLRTYYTTCLRDLPSQVGRFVENELITRNGFRNSYAREDAVTAHLTEEDLAQLIRSRLVRIEERYGTQRIELSHDVLTTVVRQSRDERVEKELAAQFEAEKRKREKAEREREQAEREREQAERQQRKLRRLSVALAVLLLAVSALTVTSYAFAQEARRQGDLAFARAMAGQADRLAEQQPQLAMLLGLESLSAARDGEPSPPTGLLTALAQVSHASWPLTGPAGGVTKMAFSPDGTLLASAGGDQKVWLWDTAKRAPVKTLSGHSNNVLSVAFSPDGTLLASAGADRTILLWDIATGAPRGKPLSGHTGSVLGVAFSPDGKLLASAGSDQTVRLWYTATGAPARVPALFGHQNAVFGVAFSPDGKLLASAGVDATVRLWDTATGAPRGEPLKGHAGVVYAVAFSPDGKLLASGGDDRTVRFWDTATGTPEGAPLAGHNGAVLSVAFNPKRPLLASASADRTIRLWNTTTTPTADAGTLHGLPLAGHSSTVFGVAFNPLGDRLASASGDQTVRLWNTDGAFPFSHPLTDHLAAINGVAFNPRGTFIASAGADGKVRLWDAATESPRKETLEGHVARSPPWPSAPTARWWQVPGPTRRSGCGRPTVNHARR